MVATDKQAAGMGKDPHSQQGKQPVESQIPASWRLSFHKTQGKWKNKPTQQSYAYA